MAEEPQSSEDLIKESIDESGIAEPPKDEKRVSKIISQTRRSVGTRDFIVLTLVRFWLVLAEIICKVFVRQSKDSDNKPKKIP